MILGGFIGSLTGDYEKKFGNTISNIITTILGRLPAPFLYGYL